MQFSINMYDYDIMKSTYTTVHPASCLICVFKTDHHITKGYS
jgi:hypothetical protein